MQMKNLRVTFEFAIEDTPRDRESCEQAAEIAAKIFGEAFMMKGFRHHAGKGKQGGAKISVNANAGAWDDLLHCVAELRQLLVRPVRVDADQGVHFHA